MSHKIFVEKRNIYLIEILSNFLYVNNKIIEGAVDITSVGIQISVTQNICEKKKGIFIWLKILSTFPCTWSLYLGEYTEIMIIKQCH